MSRTYLRGDLYYADLGSGIGSEQKGNRPVVIIQNNVGNKHSPTVIIAAITSKANIKAKLPTHYYLDAGNGLGLRWDAIDFEQKTITIRHTVTQVSLNGKSTVISKDRTKTKSS